jgi:exopolysaccharide production protein ExoQ
METANSESEGTNGLAIVAGFFFSFRLVSVLFSVHLLGVEASTGAALSLVLGVLLLGLVCFDSLGLTHRTFRSVLQLWSIRWVFLFLIFSCCSLAWSETASLPDSTAYWLGLVTDVAIVVLLLRRGSAITVSHSLMKGFIWSTCCLALVAWIMPTQSDLRLGDEQFFNTNQIGNLCALSIFMAQYLIRRKDGSWRVLSFFLVVTLIRSLSKTTIVAFLVSESFLIIGDKSLSRKTKILLTAFAVVLILAFWGLFEAYYDIYTTAGNQAETFTGRTAIWLYALNAVFDHPWNLWIGHGFDAWWKVAPTFGGQFEARHAENELLQQLYAYGAIGICMLIGMYGSLWRRIRMLPQGTTKVIFSSIVLYTVVRGLAEAEPFDLLLPLWMIVMLSLLIEHASTTSDPTTVTFPIEQFKWTSSASPSLVIPKDL